MSTTATTETMTEQDWDLLWTFLEQVMRAEPQLLESLVKWAPRQLSGAQREIFDGAVERRRNAITAENARRAEHEAAQAKELAEAPEHRRGEIAAAWARFWAGVEEAANLKAAHRHC